MIIGTTQTETRFLNEAELPECARLNRKRTLPTTNDSASQDGDTAMTSGPGSSLQSEEDRQIAEALERSYREASEQK